VAKINNHSSVIANEQFENFNQKFRKFRKTKEIMAEINQTMTGK